MPSGNNVHDIDHARIFSVTRLLTLKMDRLSLLEHSRIMAGQLKVARDRKNDLFMPLAGLQLPSLLPGFQYSVDQITGMTPRFSRTEDILT